MKCDRKDLYDALVALGKASEPRAAMRVLTGVLLQAKDGYLSMRTTDLDCHLATNIPAEGDLLALADAKKLAKIVKPDGDSDIEITLVDDKLVVSADSMDVKLPAGPVEDFPAPPPDKKWTPVSTWDAAQLLAGVDYVMTAICRDDLRPHIASLAFLGNRLTCTDGHRLHVVPLPGEMPNHVVIARRSAGILQSVLKLGRHATIMEHEDWISFTVGHFTFTTKKLDVDYPPIDQVICKKTVIATVDAEKLGKMVKKLMSVGTFNCLKVVVNGEIELTASSRDDEEEVSVRSSLLKVLKPEDEILTTGIDPSFLIEAIAKMRVAELTIGGPLDPIRIDAEDRMALVMPCRI